MATNPEPSGFNPLENQPQEQAAAVQYQRNGVKNIVESYHGRFDALAEGVQNAMDALEARWKDWDGESQLDASTPPEETPTLRVCINSERNLIELIDNGIGIAAVDIESSLIPNVSPKTSSSDATRGHKGVGTTFLAYGHRDFVIQTKSY